MTILTFANSLYSNYEVQKEQLVLQALEVNRAYASKLSDTTEVFLASSQQQLSYTSSLLSNKMGDEAFLKEEVDRLRLQTNSFNSVVITDDTGIAKAVSPETTGLLGRQLKSVGSLEALEEKRSLISKPFISTIKNLLVFISTPIFDPKNNYVGFVGGTIYLKKPNILSKILGQHYYENGSYIYVVDKQKQILYHPDIDRIGDYVTNNDGIDEIIMSQEGGIVLNNSYGKNMLAGYANIPSTDWIIITQSPLNVTLIPLTGIMEKVILRTMPMVIGVFIFIWFFARAISRPLQLLAEKAKSLDNPEVNEEIEKINSWYAESLSLKKAILSGVKLLHNQIGQLQRDSETDPLTGANNRRAFQVKLKKLVLLEQPFSILSLDIDYFKQVNDNYGHNVGDEVLKQQTQLIHRFCRDGDMVARTGGEEFILLLKDVELNDAYLVAERLRIATEQEVFDTVGHITVSIGVAAWSKNSVSIDEMLSSADKALYEAKGQGRNRCIIATPDITK
nr:sensor domain-containing diguanylate cyclase [Marinomonas ushuaiensis]